MAIESDDPPLVFCKGCQVADDFGPNDAPYHLNQICGSRWEARCLLDVEEAARAYVSGDSPDLFKLREALDALTDCRKVLGTFGE